MHVNRFYSRFKTLNLRQTYAYSGISVIQFCLKSILWRCCCSNSIGKAVSPFRIFNAFFFAISSAVFLRFYSIIVSSTGLGSTYNPISSHGAENPLSTLFFILARNFAIKSSFWVVFGNISNLLLFEYVLKKYWRVGPIAVSACSIGVFSSGFGKVSSSVLLFSF